MDIFVCDSRWKEEICHYSFSDLRGTNLYGVLRQKAKIQQAASIGSLVLIAIWLNKLRIRGEFVDLTNSTNVAVDQPSLQTGQPQVQSRPITTLLLCFEHAETIYYCWILLARETGAFFNFPSRAKSRTLT
jgi:hypothetical protein